MLARARVEVLGIGQEDHGGSGPGGHRVHRQEAADRAAVRPDDIPVGPPDIQAAAVSCGVAAGERARAGHQAERTGLENSPLHQGEVPAREVGAGGPEAPRGAQPAVGFELRGLRGPRANDV